MGRYRSSDADSDYGRSARSSSKKSKRRKKERRRGRSRSSSRSDSSRYSSSRHSKKSKQKQRSPPSPERRGPSDRSRRSRSRSHDRYDSRNKRRSRSRSYERKASRRSRSPDASRRRSRSHSLSRDGRSRSGSRGRGSRVVQRRSRSRSRSYDRARSLRESSHSSVSQSLTPLQTLSVDDQRESSKPMTMAEQAEERMRQALKAAAAADEKLRFDSLRNDQKTGSPDISNSQRFANSVAAIEADKFVPSSFKSSTKISTKLKDEFPDSRSSHDDAIFGSLSVTGFTLKPDPDNRPIDLEADCIAHPSLFCDPEEKMDRWIERLSQLRRRKLEGEAMQ